MGAQLLGAICRDHRVGEQSFLDDEYPLEAHPKAQEDVAVLGHCIGEQEEEFGEDVGVDFVADVRPDEGGTGAELTDQLGEGGVEGGAVEEGLCEYDLLFLFYNYKKKRWNSGSFPTNCVSSFYMK